jgi:hypothetical protein
MEVVRPNDDNAPGAFAEDGARVLEALAQLIAETPLTDDLPARAVDRVVDLLGLSGATLSVVSKQDDSLNLEAIASVGAHAAFARDMSARPLESLADAATAVSEGRPVFVVDEHGKAASPAPEKGVARWRSSISAHATGVLPVRAWGETLGVLTIEWPGSRPLGEREEALLEAVAGLLGTMLHDIKRAEEGAAIRAASTLDATAAGERTEILGVTANGIVVPLAEGVVGDVEPVVVLSVVSRRVSGAEVPIWDLVNIGSDRVAIGVGLATAPESDPDELAETIRAALRTYASQGVGPAEALGYLEHSVRATGSEGARLSVASCVLSLGGPARTLSFSTAGAVMWAALGSGGRLTSGQAGRAALSAAGGAHAEERHLLLLPGDRAAVICGPVGPLNGLEGRTSMATALGSRESSATQAARSILGALGEPDRAASVVVIEVHEGL